MEADSIGKAAVTLLGAYASRAPVPPLTATYPGISVDDAYAIQLAQVTAWTAAGAVVKGHKVGLTSAAMQKQLGVTQPDFGVLLDNMFLPEGITADITRFLPPGRSSRTRSICRSPAVSCTATAGSPTPARAAPCSADPRSTPSSGSPTCSAHAASGWRRDM
jgi:2-keto-4-pentenoate hydratase